MKKLILGLLLFLSINVFSQAKLNSYIGKTFVFQNYAPIKESDAFGDTGNNKPIIALEGSLFTVKHITPSGDFVIKFNTWVVKGNVNKKDSLQYKDIIDKQLKYNFKTTQKSEIKLFRLEKNNMEMSCSEFPISD